MWFWARSEGIHHWEPAWELLLTFSWSFERLNISIHLILWCPPWPALLKNKFCSILTFLANLDKKKKIKNVNLARLCARLKPVFLSKKGPSKASLLTKMSPSEELGTLMVANMVVDEVAYRTFLESSGQLSIASAAMRSVNIRSESINTFVQKSKATLRWSPIGLLEQVRYTQGSKLIMYQHNLIHWWILRTQTWPGKTPFLILSLNTISVRTKIIMYLH